MRCLALSLNNEFNSISHFLIFVPDEKLIFQNAYSSIGSLSMQIFIFFSYILGPKFYGDSAAKTAILGEVGEVPSLYALEEHEEILDI